MPFLSHSPSQYASVIWIFPLFLRGQTIFLMVPVQALCSFWLVLPPHTHLPIFASTLYHTVSLKLSTFSSGSQCPCLLLCKHIQVCPTPVLVFSSGAVHFNVNLQVCNFSLIKRSLTNIGDLSMSVIPVQWLEDNRISVLFLQISIFRWIQM